MIVKEIVKKIFDTETSAINAASEDCKNMANNLKNVFKIAVFLESNNTLVFKTIPQVKTIKNILNGFVEHDFVYMSENIAKQILNKTNNMI